MFTLQTSFKPFLLLLYQLTTGAFYLSCNKASNYGKYTVKRFTSFPSPAGMSLTKLPLGGNNSVMTSLFPARESLVVTSRLGTGNSRTFFLRCKIGREKNCFYVCWSEECYSQCVRRLIYHQRFCKSRQTAHLFGFLIHFMFLNVSFSCFTRCILVQSFTESYGAIIWLLSQYVLHFRKVENIKPLFLLHDNCA